MLELDGLSRRYGDVVALEDLSFAVERGQMVGFVGPNGAGKTTTMRIVLGVLAPDRGEVRWEGAPLDVERRRRFGYMPEERGLYPKMRVAEQLAYFALLHGRDDRAAESAAAEWLERLGLSERGEDRLEELSLGNQQRVQLAAALVHQPDALLLDEPFSGLDPLGADVLADVLAEERRRGVAIVFSSHQLELVERICELVAIIKDGRLVAFGRIDELRRERRRNRWRIAMEGAGPGWAEGLPGVEVLEHDGGTLVVELADGADEQQVLDAARRAGCVRHFSAVEPTLAELFREVATR